MVDLISHTFCLLGVTVMTKMLIISRKANHMSRFCVVFLTWSKQLFCLRRVYELIIQIFEQNNQLSFMFLNEEV